MNRDDLMLYVMGEYDGDVAAVERALASDEEARAIVADEARVDLLLRDAAAAAVFCPACGDLVRATRCDACGAAARPGGYVVERVLVANAHGRMYVARDADGKQVALKELAFVHAPSADAIAAFEREAVLVRALDHAGIPRFVASFEEGQGVHARYYLAQELVAGEPLDARLADHFYGEAEIIDIARQVLEIVVYLQSVSPMIIHRDVKPANLLRRADGTIALVDFGAAHVQGTTAGSTTIGTFGYMPIEQLAGIVDATTDPYALGSTLVHLLTRQEPWKVLHADGLAINVSRPLRAFIDRLVARDPRARFPDAAAALAALRTLGVARPRSTGRVWRHLATAAIAAGLVAGGAFGARMLLQHDDTPVVTYVERASPPSVIVPAAPERSDPLPAGREVDLDFKGTKIVDVLLLLAHTCDVNVVVPDYIDVGVSMKLSKIRCDHAIPALLEANELGYVYHRDGNVMRVASRKDLAAEVPLLQLVAARAGDALPTGGDTVDFDFKGAPVRDLLDIIAKTGGVNVLYPDYINGKVSVRLAHVPWQRALETVLRAHELGYRYHAAGRVLTIAPLKDLAAESRSASPKSAEITPPPLKPPPPALPPAPVLPQTRVPAPLCQPPSRMNPFDTRCNGAPCPPCPK
jgi:hypothetical protein